MEDQKAITQRLDALEASIRSFSFTYAEIEKLLEKSVTDLQVLGDGLRHTAQLFGHIGYGYRADPLRDSDKAAKKIAVNIGETLAILRTYWYGPEWKDMEKGVDKNESIEGKD